MYTPDQEKFIEDFTSTRDRLSLEVGLLTQEKETLLFDNEQLAESNASLRRGIDEMNANASKIGFEQSNIVASLKAEVVNLETEISLLKNKRELMAKDLDEKNNTLINLSLLIKSIQVATEDTTSHIRKITGDLNVYTSRVSSTASTIESQVDRVKKYADELGGVIDQERKTNYLKTKEIDDRENAVITREKLVNLQYAKAKAQ